MTHPLSRAIPLIVLALIGGTTIYEAHTGEAIDLEAWMPILAALGLGGLSKSIIGKVKAGRDAMPPIVRQQIKAAMESAKLNARKAASADPTIKWTDENTK